MRFEEMIGKLRALTALHGADPQIYAMRASSLSMDRLYWSGHKGLCTVEGPIATTFEPSRLDYTGNDWMVVTPQETFQ